MVLIYQNVIMVSEYRYTNDQIIFQYFKTRIEIPKYKKYQNLNEKSKLE